MVFVGGFLQLEEVELMYLYYLVIADVPTANHFTSVSVYKSKLDVHLGCVFPLHNTHNHSHHFMKWPFKKHSTTMKCCGEN
jgi:hypothetical protein